MKKSKILITGVSGLLGNNLAYYFKDKYRILGLYNSHPVSIPGIQSKKGDITAKGLFRGIVDDFKPDILIHCASLTDLDFCEVNKKLTDKINVYGTKVAAGSVNDNDTKLIYISTDSVYNGTKGNFSEIDTPDPLNYYGISKYKGEAEVLKKKNSLVLRTNLFGWNIQDKCSLAEWIIRELSNNREIRGFQDAFFSSIYTFEMAKIIDLAIEKDLSGVYNCGSRKGLSKYEFANRIAGHFNLNKSLIRPISIDDFDFKAKRGKNLILDVSKLTRDLGYMPPAMTESIKAFHADHEKGIPQKIKQKGVLIKSKSIPYGKQTIDKKDINEAVKILRSDWITQGPRIKEFEDALCKYAGAKYAVCVSNGTAALHTACLAAGIKEGDEVITSPMTFVASANCVLFCGGKPVFADIQEDTMNIDPKEIKRKITKKTKAIIPVHFAGHPCDLEDIYGIAREHDLIVIEDAAHALGAEYKGSKIGSCEYSDMAVFSFHPVKSITTGEGGAVLTNKKDLYERLLVFRNHGIVKDNSRFTIRDPRSSEPWYYEMHELGYNYRITDFQCAIGIAQLKKLDNFLRRRKDIAERYKQAFKDNEYFDIPKEKSRIKSSWHLYPVRLKDGYKERKAEIFKKIREENIGVQVHYIPVHLQPYYRNRFGYKKGDYPIAERYYERALSLPLYPRMTDADIKYVVGALKKIL